MKKSEFITFRTDQETKRILDALAAEKRRTISFLTGEIVKEWLEKEKTEDSEREV